MTIDESHRLQKQVQEPKVENESSQVFSKSAGFQDKTLAEEEEEANEFADAYDEEIEVEDNIDNNKKDYSDKAILKIHAPLSDRKDTEKLKMMMMMIKGQIQSEVIDDVQDELKKKKK